MRYFAGLIIALVVLAGLGWQATAHGQTPNVLRIVEAHVDPIQVANVELTVSYTTAQGAPVQPAPMFTVTISGTTIPLTNTTTVQKPLAAAIITDLSPRMNDQGTAYTTRFNTMLPLAQALVSQLQGQPSGTLASLVVLTQTVTIGHALTSDVQLLNNTMNRANDKLLFQPQPLGDPASAAPYPLGDALLRGLDELAKAPPEVPRLLVVYAAGDPRQQVDLPKLKAAMDEARTQKRPISLLILGFGTDQPGSFTTFPAAPGSLQEIATELGGSFIPINSATPDAQTKQQIDAAYAALLQRSQHYVLHFTANQVAAGKTTIEVAADGSSDTQEVDFSNAPPHFDVVVDSRSFQDQVQLSIQTKFAQQPITEVSYFLDNIPVAPPVTNQPHFELPVNAYAADFQQRFPPGEHTLTAAARYANGIENRSDQPITITVIKPPDKAPSRFDQLVAYWWVFALLGIAIVGLVVAAVILFLRIRRPVRLPRPVTAPQNVQYEIEEPTTSYGSGADEPTGVYDSDSTLTYIPLELEDKTLPFDPNVEQPPRLHWFLDIFNGNQHEQVALAYTQRHYDIGRVMRQGRQAHIAIDNSLISQTHAKLELLRDDLYLIAGESKNGTFYGPDQRPLADQQRIKLQSGDVFWLSPRVKLRVESKTEAS